MSQDLHRSQKYCKMCGRLMHASSISGLPPGDPSTDCGGDCWGCIKPIEQSIDERYGVEDPAEWLS